MFSLKANPCAGLIFPLALVAFVLPAAPAHASTIQDVEFVMAADSGISASDWANEKDFVQDALENLLTPSATRVGIVDFSSTTQVRLTSRLLSTLSQTTIESTISNLPFTQGQAHISDGLELAVQDMELHDLAAESKLIVLISTGNPNPAAAQNPCDTSGANADAATLRGKLTSDNIDVLEVMIGADQHSGTLGCLVNNDSSRIVQITGAAAALSAALAPDTPVSSAPEPGTFGFAFGALGFVGLAMRRGIRG
jgi:hypothetical protein